MVCTDGKSKNNLIRYNYIFTEGGTKAGFGHLTRCIALYDELEKRRLHPIFVINGDRTVEGILADRRYSFNNWYDNWMQYLYGNELKPNCIIDSYLATEKTYLQIQKQCKKTLYIDDTNRIAYPDGIIVNPSIFGDSIPYIKRQGQQYLIGGEYIILREEFQQSCHREIKETPRDILVILGGSDIRNLTPQIIKSLTAVEFEGKKKHIVIGSAFKNIKEIEMVSRECSTVNLYYNLDALRLYTLMEQCDLAITAAGQTVYELIAMRLPFICIKVIDNQLNNITGLIRYGIINDYLDCSETTNNNSLNKYITDNMAQYQSKIRRENRAKSMEKINIGKGVRRIIDALVEENGNK